MGDSEETSPDSLKNTPSNIAKLEDVIEQSKGRQKYLAHTRSPSDGGDVRWYFCKVPLLPKELAASVPKTEIVGKGDYFRFSIRDSLAIEACFLQREDELLSSWWREYAECSEGPCERISPNNKLDKQPNASSSDVTRSAELFEAEEERVGVPVKGGLYEVDLVKRHSFPVYWNGENRRVLRGHWFGRKGGLDWLPLREDVAEQLEVAYRSQVWHRRRFQPSGLFAARVDLQGSTPGLHAIFTGEDDTWEAWLNIAASGFFSVVSFSGNGIKLRRGYSASHSAKPSQDELRQQKEEEMDDYCSQVPVRHLVFMVHGIGQRLEKSNLVDDVSNFRNITASLAEQHLTSHQRGAQRVLYIPCQWRKGLKLSGETAVDKCTLDGVRGLRVMLSATVHDVLYYMSPIYCQDIINSVSNELNLLYLKFLKRNPGYDGKVSLYGHSLGSVLSYDILCHQEKLSSPFPMDWMYKEHAKNEESSHDVNGQPVARDSSSSPMDWMYKEHAKNEESSHDVNGQLVTHDSSTNPEDKSSTVMNDTKDKVDSTDEETMSAQSTVLIHGHDNGISSIDCPVMSDLNEITATAVDSEQTGGKVDGHELVQSSCETLSPEKGDLNEAAFRNCGAPDGGVDKMAEEKCTDTSDKDTAINLLREEIYSLKEKIAELESQCDGRGTSENSEVLSRKSKQAIYEEPPPKLDDVPMSYTPYIKYTKLEFKVDTFFAVGSPLGVFLALRNIRIGIGKGQEYWEEENTSEEMPACRQIFNIFHPFDPVAYRIEPLVCKEYLSKRPVIIPYHRGGRRLHIGFQEFTEDLAARSQAIRDHFNSVRIKVLTACQSRNDDDLEEGAEHGEEKEERSYGSVMMEMLTGSEEGRIDHMLQDKTFEHPYLQAIGAHTNYWRDYDTALFILRHLYREIPEDLSTPTECSGVNSKSGSGSTGWPDQRETADEELPLTFSDRTMVRNFSRRAQKFTIKK